MPDPAPDPTPVTVVVCPLGRVKPPHRVSGRGRDRRGKARRHARCYHQTDSRPVSNRALAQVWDHSPYRAGAKLVILLAVADVVNDANGNRFYMKAENLAAKAYTSRATAQRTLAELVGLGWLVPTRHGGGRSRPNEYVWAGPESVSNGHSIGSESVSNGAPKCVERTHAENPRNPTSSTNPTGFTVDCDQGPARGGQEVGGQPVENPDWSDPGGV